MKKNLVMKFMDESSVSGPGEFGLKIEFIYILIYLLATLKWERMLPNFRVVLKWNKYCYTKSNTEFGTLKLMFPYLCVLIKSNKPINYLLE